MGGDTIKSFTNLNAWKEGHKLVLSIYEMTRNFPNSELFGLASQIRRAAISITSNISEGFSRRNRKEKIQFYHIALGSLTELQNQLIIARDVKYIIQTKFMEIANQTIVVSKLINGLIKSCESKPLIHNS